MSESNKETWSTCFEQECLSEMLVILDFPEEMFLHFFQDIFCSGGARHCVHCGFFWQLGYVWLPFGIREESSQFVIKGQWAVIIWNKCLQSPVKKKKEKKKQKEILVFFHSGMVISVVARHYKKFRVWTKSINLFLGKSSGHAQFLNRLPHLPEGVNGGIFLPPPSHTPDLWPLPLLYILLEINESHLHGLLVSMWALVWSEGGGVQWEPGVCQQTGPRDPTAVEGFFEWQSERVNAANKCARTDETRFR